jgi:hypothetical protein
MTQDEIMGMAQQCGLIGMRPHLDGIYSEALEAFAKLVEEKVHNDAKAYLLKMHNELSSERTGGQA